MVVDIVECLDGDTFCETDHVGFEAIAQLHSQIDDDQDGSLNRAESAEVLMLLTAAALIIVIFLQCFRIARNAERCNSRTDSVCLSICLIGQSF